jgi:hypothetical protein
VLVGRLVDPDRGDVLSLTVDWGDGSPAETFHPGTAPFRVTHRYAGAGRYAVRLRWADAAGRGNSRVLSLVVSLTPDSDVGVCG